MCRLVLITLFSIVLAMSVCSPSFARRIERWSYDELFKESDLIVVATPLSSHSSKETTSDNIWNEKMLGVNTTFRVSSVNKGSISEHQLTVLHYKLANAVKIDDGPLLVSFRLKSLELKTVEGKKISFGKPEYLLFLKKRPDDRYEPVSGQIDPLLSVRELIHPLPEG
jgi:hypothetical protein